MGCVEASPKLSFRAVLAWQCAFPLYKESLNPQTWVEHPHDTLKFLLGIQLLLGTPRYTWGNGAHGMLRAADVAVMLLWCLWPMRVVLPGGLLQVDKLRWSASGSETKRLGSETRLRKLRTRVSET